MQHADWRRVVLTLAVVGAASGNALAQATFHGLGIPEGFVGTSVSAVSGDGSAVVGSAFGVTPPYPGADRGFRWSAATGFELVAPLAGDWWTTANVVSADGTAVLGRSVLNSAERVRVIRWTAAGGSEDLQIGRYTVAAAAADLSVFCGQTGIGAYEFEGSNAYPLWEPSTLTGVSEDGSVVVGDAQPSAGLMFVVDAASLNLYFPGEAPSGWADYSGGISGDGRVAVGTLYQNEAPNGQRAFVWTAGLRYQMLAAGSTADHATGANHDATIIVGQSLMDTPSPRASVWVNGAYHDVETLLTGLGAAGLGGWALHSVTVSSDGRTLAGTGIDPQGATEAWAATLPQGFGCYANCDGSAAAPVLNVADFTCFLQKFASGELYANCDGSTAQPVFNVADFTCFLQKFAGGCP